MISRSLKCILRLISTDLVNANVDHRCKHDGSILINPVNWLDQVCNDPNIRSLYILCIYVGLGSNMDWIQVKYWSGLARRFKKDLTYWVGVSQTLTQLTWSKTNSKGLQGLGRPIITRPGPSQHLSHTWASCQRKGRPDPLLFYIDGWSSTHPVHNT